MTLQAIPNLGTLAVMIDCQTVGIVEVTRRYPRKLFGAFTPTAEFEPYRPVFEAAVELARQYDSLPTNEPCDYLLWDRLMAAYAEINRLKPVLAELPVPIEEFAVEADWSVEITFEAVPIQPSAAPDCGSV
jgi:hypothetical protein